MTGVESKYRTLASEDPKLLNRRFLAETLAAAAANVPYYAEWFAREKVAVDPDDPDLALARLPVLTKATIRENFDRLTSTQGGPKPFQTSSGGSTGSPQTFVQDKDFVSWGEATFEYYFRTFHSIDHLAVPKVVLWGSERDTRNQSNLSGKLRNSLLNTVFLNSFNVTPDRWRDYIQTLNRVRPYFLRGYAGSLYEMARFAKENRLEVYQPRFIYSAAEMLRPFMRETIEAVFRAKVYDFFGSREVGPIAGECREGNRHIFIFHNHVEVTDDGRILITTLHNRTMPLLRYDIGDTGALGSGPCRCGSPLPWFSEISGRITDHFRKRGGELVHGEYFTHLFYHQDWLRHFQVNQRGFEEIEILYVADAEAPQDRRREIDEYIRGVMGPSTQIIWTRVPEIPKTPQGKRLFTRCLLPQS
jgi:phenylacetate-CoA ligase